MILVDLKSARGERQGIPKLTLDLSVESQADVLLAVVNVTVAIRVAQEWFGPAEHPKPRPHLVGDMGKSRFIGVGFLESGGGQLSPRGKTSWQIGVPLSPHQLQKIEEVRKGKDLFLNVQFYCTAGWRSNLPPPTVTDITPVAVRVSGYSDGNCPFKVPQSEWIKVLGELGYGDYFLMEIPLRGVPERQGMQKALEHLKTAWGHFEQGNDDETLGNCYKAFEYLAKKNKCKHPDVNGFERILGAIPEQEKRTRLKMLMHNLCQFLTLGRHEPGTEAVILDGRESEYGLILSQATLSYLAKLMRETTGK